MYSFICKWKSFSLLGYKTFSMVDLNRKVALKIIIQVRVQNEYLFWSKRLEMEAQKSCQAKQFNSCTQFQDTYSEMRCWNWRIFGRLRARHSGVHTGQKIKPFSNMMGGKEKMWGYSQTSNSFMLAHISLYSCTWTCKHNTKFDKRNC